MRRILRVELRRFGWRRSFRLFGLIAIGGIALTATIMFFESKPKPDAAQQAEAIRADILAECEQAMEGQPVRGYGSVREYCENEWVPPLESFDPRFHITELTEVFGGTSIPLIILGLAFGASFIGAEWHHGTITPLLTWAPRRVPVFLGKSVAASIGVFLSAVALQVVLGLALWFVAAVRGTTEGADLAWFWETAAVLGRGALIAGLAAMLGFAIASVARNTTFALIIGFVYFAVGESLLRGFKPNWQRWLIGDNAAAFVLAEPEVIFFPARTAPSTLGALLTVVGYTALFTALATAWFQSRDVS